jgi:hypothetical protein
MRIRVEQRREALGRWSVQQAVVFRTIGDQSLQPRVHGVVAVAELSGDGVPPIQWRVEQRIR